MHSLDHWIGHDIYPNSLALSQWDELGGCQCHFFEVECWAWVGVVDGRLSWITHDIHSSFMIGCYRSILDEMTFILLGFFGSKSRAICTRVVLDDDFTWTQTLMDLAYQIQEKEYSSWKENGPNGCLSKKKWKENGCDVIRKHKFPLTSYAFKVGYKSIC